MQRNRLVYSTGTGRLCPECGRTSAECRCRRSKPAQAAPTAPAGDGIVRVGRETKGRKGKGVTLVKGVPLDEVALNQLGKQLKAACGCGGTVKDGVVEVQGDHVDRVVALLVAQGYKAKRAGG